MARRTCFAPLVPRPPRIQSSETLFHLTTRSVRRTPLFRDDTDRWMFFAIVDSVVARHNWICHAYCLMTTHYHLLPVEGLSDEPADQP